MVLEIRAVVKRAQIGVFANNEALVYDFHGITDDGLHCVNVIFPIDAPILLSTHDPKENTNEEAIRVPDVPDEDPGGTILNDTIVEYNQEAQQQLDHLSSSSYIPDLNFLDEPVGSIQILSSNEE